MRIKTFQGRTLEEVLPQIREQLGASAVVLGQRSVVNGGVGGFFGKRMIEVTAADSMPSDDELVDLEARLVDGKLRDGESGGEDTAADDAQVAETADRLRAAMSMGRRGGLDVVDDWDPAADEELAGITGTAPALPTASASATAAAPRVRPARDVAGYADLMLPQIEEPAVSDATPVSDPVAQAQRLVERAHANLEAQTQRIEANALGTYARPASQLPQTSDTTTSHTFSASVQPTTQHAPQLSAETAEAIRGDLGLEPGASTSNDAIAEAIAAAVDVIDLKAMAALRSAMNASRTSIEAIDRNDASTEFSGDTDALMQQLTDAGVDHDVVTSIIDTVMRHRRPFSAEQNVLMLAREVIEQNIEVSSGFPRLSRTWRTAFVGAGSSGKTTVVAKVAQGYQAAGMRVAIVAIMAGTQRTSGTDQALQNSGVDVRYVASPEQASDAATAFSGHDLVLIDTPGSIYLDAVAYDAVRGCLDAMSIDDVQVVVPLTTSTREASSLIDAFRPLGANRVVVSRVDESRFSGQLLNYGFRLGLPMTFLSDGPRVPEDLRAASAREIVDLVLPADAAASK